jgi:hypothetical protein
MSAANVLGRRRPLTKSDVKRHVAACITEAQARNGWSNPDAADILGCCDNTIVNRKDGDDPGKQMTVYELLRAATADEMLANDIVALVDLVLARRERAPDSSSDLQKVSSIMRATLAVSVMLEDHEITVEEIHARRGELEAGRDAFQALLDRIGPKGGAA